MGLTSLASSLFTQTSENRSEVMITGLSARDDSPQESFVFQHFPETLADEKAINHSPKAIPGGSLPLYQWISSGERTLSFTAVFTTDVDLLAQGVNKAAEVFQRIEGAGVQRDNVDIRTALAYLRTYMFPTYAESQGQGTPVTYAPRKLRLTIPRSGIGLFGGSGAGAVMPDSVICIMTACSLNMVQYFPSGLPRIAEASLTFAQVAQAGGRINFPASVLDVLPAVNTSGASAQGLGLDLAGALGSVGSLFGGSGNAGETLGSLQSYTLQPRKLKG